MFGLALLINSDCGFTWHTGGSLAFCPAAAPAHQRGGEGVPRGGGPTSSKSRIDQYKMDCVQNSIANVHVLRGRKKKRNPFLNIALKLRVLRFRLMVGHQCGAICNWIHPRGCASLHLRRVMSSPPSNRGAAANLDHLDRNWDFISMNWSPQLSSCV